MGKDKDSLPALPPHKVREVAVAADVHPKTVERFLAGKAIRAMNEERIRKALGLAAPAPSRRPA